MITIRIEGMSCGHCEAGVKKALEAVPGVEQVIEVSKDKQQAVVEGNADVNALIQAVQDEGYTASAA